MSKNKPPMTGFRRAPLKKTIGALLLASLSLTAGACRQDMHDQPKLKTYREGADRVPPEGAVARGTLAVSAPVAEAGAAKSEFPFAITAEVLARGENRFNINCAPCHSKLGDGNGMIVQRGFKRPPSYHEERLRNSPASYFYDVMTNGFGAMASYSDKLSVEDRWKVAAYIRVLQVSHNAKIEDVPAAERAKLEAADAAAPQGGQTQ
ncbi:MAG: cytochrome c [Blastocatellales bacterium]|nr:cytochrome c [Blastocatellales bacterium]